MESQKVTVLPSPYLVRPLSSGTDPEHWAGREGRVLTWLRTPTERPCDISLWSNVPHTLPSIDTEVKGHLAVLLRV